MIPVSATLSGHSVDRRPHQGSDDLRRRRAQPLCLRSRAWSVVLLRRLRHGKSAEQTRRLAPRREQCSRRLLAAEHEPVGRIDPELRGIRSSRSRHGRDRPLAALALLHEPILSVATKTGKNVECRCGGGRRETERVRLLVRKSRPMAPSFTSFYIVLSHWWYDLIAVVGGSGS